MPRAPWSFLLLAVALRTCVCLRTEVPGRDGVTYLWMAEACARGEPGALFQTVFHPLYPAVVAPLLWLWPSLDPIVAGQLVAAGAGAVAVVPLWLLTRALFGGGAATGAALAYATGAWFCRHPAECMSEGVFYPCVAGWATALLWARPRPLLAGVAAGLAYLARPEGAALLCVGAVALAVRRQWRAATLLLAGGGAVAVVLPLGFAAWGDGFTLTPKATFNLAVGIGQAAAPMGHYLHEAAALPLAAAEELGWLWLPLAVAGAVARRPRSLGDPAVLLLAPFLLQCLVVPLLHSHWRFLSGFGVLLLPFAGVAVAALWTTARRAGRRWPWLLVLLLGGAESRVFAARNDGRAIERDLGRELRSCLGTGEFVVSDMPRLDYFAGQKPPPPRPILATEVLARAAAPGCRFVALVAGRTEVADAALFDVGLEPMAPPPLLSAEVGRRGVRLFVRTRPR